MAPFYQSQPPALGKKEGGSNFASREGDMGTGDCKLPHGGNSCSREGKLGTGDSKPRMEQRRGGELTLQAMDLDFLQ